MKFLKHEEEVDRMVTSHDASYIKGLKDIMTLKDFFKELMTNGKN